MEKVDFLRDLKKENEWKIPRVKRNTNEFNQGFARALIIQNREFKREIQYLEGKRQLPY